MEVWGWHFSLRALLLPEPRVAAATIVSRIRLPWRAQQSGSQSALHALGEGLPSDPSTSPDAMPCSASPLWSFGTPLSVFLPGLGDILSQASQGSFYPGSFPTFCFH